MNLRVIVPILNEADQLPDFIQHHGNLLQREQVIFIDGGSTDDSREIIERSGYRYQLSSLTGRAVQMNLGATIAAEPYLMFLHVDTRLPTDFSEIFSNWVAHDPVWGYFSIRLTGRNFIFRIIEIAVNLRARISQSITGDQVFVVRSKVFEKIGGFPRVALMEDVIMSRKLRRLARPRRFATPVVTSSRRWEERGVLRTIGLMWWLRLLFNMGVSPTRLARLYR